MIHNLNLVKQIPDKEIRDNIARWLYGIIPCDGKTRSIESILENKERYIGLANDIENRKTNSNKIYV